MIFEEILFEKQAYPFKLCTTTFIHPADWLTNARALGRSFDELELLLFESAYPESLPDEKYIQSLADLATELEFSWNVHLPTDIYPGHPDPELRARSVAVIKKVVTLTSPLNPSTCTLHLPGLEGRPEKRIVQKWCGHLSETLQNLTDAGIPGRCFSIENLPEYPLETILPLIEEFDLDVCLDIGHLILSGGSLAPAFDLFGDRISILHIHGVANGRDHRSLDQLPRDKRASLFEELCSFKGTVSLEVFSHSDLLASLECFSKEWA